MNDILLDGSFDLLVENGDFATGESSGQHQELLLLTQKGDWREDTTVGVGLSLYLKDDEAAAFVLGAIKIEFERDGMKVSRVEMVNGKISVNAYYP